MKAQNTTQAGAAKSFSEFYSLAEFIQFTAHQDKCPHGVVQTSPEQKDWSAKQDQFYLGLNRAFTQYLVSMRDLGRLTPIPVPDDFEHPFADRWNRLIANNDDEIVSERTLKIVGLTFDHAFWLVLRKNAKMPTEQLHTLLVQKVDDGQFDASELNYAAHKDNAETGEYLSVDMRGWAPQLGVLDYEVSPLAFQPIYVGSHETEAASTARPTCQQ